MRTGLVLLVILNSGNTVCLGLQIQFLYVPPSGAGVQIRPQGGYHDPPDCCSHHRMS